MSDMDRQHVTETVATPKQYAFIGINGQPVLNDHFLTVANDAAPDTGIWTVVEDNDASVIREVSYNALTVIAGTGGTNDGYMSTVGKKEWDVLTVPSGITELHFKSKFKVADLTGEFGIGLLRSTITPTADNFDGTNIHGMTIHCDNDVLNFVSGDNTTAKEETAVTAYFSNGARVEIELVVTIGVYARCYINGTLRATHSTRYPNQNALMAAIASKNTNGVTTFMYNEYVEVWTE